jgi:hypothetical protein
MAAPNASYDPQGIPIEMVGGNKFGRYAKISDSQTFNMIVSDGWLVDYAGYKMTIPQSPNSKGRALYVSTRGNLMIAVLGSTVYRINQNLEAEAITNGVLATTSGQVYINENNSAQITLSDGLYLYVYNWNNGTFVQLSSTQFPFQNPGYIGFQNGRLIVAILGTTNWVLSASNDATSWPTGSANVASLQTKPDTVQAAFPMPGRGNMLMVFGSNVGEQWTDAGQAKFPYVRATSFNIDYGCINAATIATLDHLVMWLATNEQSGVVLMQSDGGSIKEISTDGINFKFSTLTAPQDCIGFLYKLDGHLIYQFTFTTDNLTYLYDISTETFFTATDENMNYHIARQVVLFHNKYYFVSINGGNIYEIGTKFTAYDYGFGNVHEIPRIRITPPFRLPTQRNFIIKKVAFTAENGQPNTFTKVITQSGQTGTQIATESGLNIATESGELIDTEGDTSVETTYLISNMRIDLSISRNGAESFGSSYGLDMNPTGKYRNMMNWQRLGQANDVTLMFRMWGYGRYCITNGLMEIFE